MPEIQLTDREGDGYDETIVNATPRTRVMYELAVENRDSHDMDGDLDTFEPCGPPGEYHLELNVMGDDVTVLSSARLTFTIEE